MAMNSATPARVKAMTNPQVLAAYESANAAVNTPVKIAKMAIS
mgnify:CR=1 FL=1